MEEERIKETRIKAKKIIDLTKKYSLHILALEEGDREVIMLRLYNNIMKEYSLNKLLLMNREEALKVSNSLKEILEEIKEES
jgi:hypothetical protein